MSHNKQDKLLHKYSLMDAAVDHLKSVKKIKFAPDESVIAEINKPTKKITGKNENVYYLFRVWD